MKSKTTVWALLFIIGLGLRCTELFHPVDTASWRESDMSSIARNYYRNGMDFFHPQIDWGGRGPGYTESEFPMYPYLIAVSYKLTGIWEPTGRILSFLFSLATMLIFFRLSRHLFNARTAFVVSFFFALSPLLLVISSTIQPESLMFFFYIGAAYMFIRWIESQSKKHYISTILFTGLALLCKISAINIGILFVLLLLINNGWRYLYKPKVILLGMLCILPSIVWYTYSHNFYTLYGNSLGLSNEYAWIGLDFFTNPYFIKGILKTELVHIWTYSGLFILLIALLFTKLIKRKDIIFPVCWLVAPLIFYIVTARTSADNWAFYYHIFSVPSASILLGISVIELYDKYFSALKLRLNPSSNILDFMKSRLIIIALFFVAFSYLAFILRYTMRSKPNVFNTSTFYKCKNSLAEIIPQGSLILVTGGACNEDKHAVAYNASYFFYWLDRKGYNICIENQTIDNVLTFKENGAVFYVAEIQALQLKQGFEEEMRKNFKVVLECDGIVLFQL
jgi:hypothetical protein